MIIIHHNNNNNNKAWSWPCILLAFRGGGIAALHGFCGTTASVLWCDYLFRHPTRWQKSLPLPLSSLSLSFFSPLSFSQSYTSKGIWRQGVGSFVRHFYVQHYALLSYALTCALLTNGDYNVNVWVGGSPASSATSYIDAVVLLTGRMPVQHTCYCIKSWHSISCYMIYYYYILVYESYSC